MEIHTRVLETVVSENSPIRSAWEFETPEKANYTKPHPPNTDTVRRHDEFQLRIDRLRDLTCNSESRISVIQSQGIDALLPQLHAEVDRLRSEVHVLPRVEQLASAQRELVQRVHDAELRQWVVDRLAEGGPRGSVRIMHLEIALARWLTAARDRRRMVAATDRLWPLPRAFRQWRDIWRQVRTISTSIEAQLARAREERELERALWQGELEAAKEAAAEQRREHAVRRMMNAHLARGWHKWTCVWRQLQSLRRAAGVLRQPGLVRCVRRWCEMTAERRALARALSRMRSPALGVAWRTWRDVAVRAARIRAHEEREVARRQLSEKEGTLATREAAHAREVQQLKGQLAAMEAELLAARDEGETMVRQRQERAVKRMMQLNLARGWSAWVALANERRELLRATRRLRNPGLAKGWRAWMDMLDEQRRLRNAASRLRNPAMSHAWREWRAWAAAEATRGRQSLWAEMEDRLQKATADAAHLASTLATREAAHAREAQQLREQLAAKEAELQAAHFATDEAVKQREEAVRLRQQQAVRRMRHADLGRAYNTWVEMAIEMDRLGRAVRTFRNPRLAQGWREWARMVDDARRLRRATAAWRELGMALSLREGRKGALHEFTRTAGEKRKEAEDAFSELQARLEEAQRSMADTDKHEAETRRRLEGSLGT